MFEDSTHGGRQNWWLRYPTFLRTSTHALTEGDSFIGNWRCALIISTHALTEGDRLRLQLLSAVRISTHALTEGDADIFCRFLRQKISTHALTEGDKDSVAVAADALISTHALTEGDAVLPGMYRRTAHFNSRPHGGRRTSYTVSYECLKFQLTPSRRATIDKDVIIAYNIFQLTPSRRATFTSSHALFIIFDISTHALTEGDGLSLLSFPVRCYFNSRPHGGRQYPGFAGSMTSPHFNSRPHGGRRQI